MVALEQHSRHRPIAVVVLCEKTAAERFRRWLQKRGVYANAPCRSVWHSMVCVGVAQYLWLCNGVRCCCAHVALINRTEMLIVIDVCFEQVEVAWLNATAQELVPQGICNRYVNYTAHPAQTPGVAESNGENFLMRGGKTSTK